MKTLLPLVLLALLSACLTPAQLKTSDELKQLRATYASAEPPDKTVEVKGKSYLVAHDAVFLCDADSRKVMLSYYHTRRTRGSWPAPRSWDKPLSSGSVAIVGDFALVTISPKNGTPSVEKLITPDGYFGVTEDELKMMEFTRQALETNRDPGTPFSQP